MKNILLPTDFSENSWNAIVYALKLFSDQRCNFYLLHVNKLSYVIANESPFMSSSDFIENTFTKPSKKRLRLTLKRISEHIPENKNHHFFTFTDYKFFIESVREHVIAKQIDLIVMGTKGASGLKKVIVGSNAADVITKVKCNTLIIPENSRLTELKEIAFPTDYDFSYRLQILQLLSELVEAHKSHLHIVHITHNKEVLNISQQNNKDLLEDYFNQQYVRFYNLTNKNVESAIQCFVESRKIDMIAMAAKNLNYFQQILFHSKVKEISYHTEIPFLVLHE